MLVVLKAKDEGLFLKEYRLGKYPVPPIFIAIEEYDIENILKSSPRLLD